MDRGYMDWSVYQCIFVSIDDIIIYSRNAVEHIYHLRLVSERLSEAGIKIKPADGKQKSMTYSSETEASEHSLVIVIYSYTLMYRNINCCIHTTLQGDQIMFRLKKWILYSNLSAILDFRVRNVF